jgi:large subunit ribosomal protein L9
MKILLLEDVDNLGLAGSVVTVADGYGRNYLIPRGMAQLATEGALKQADQIRVAGERKRTRELSDAQALGQRIEEVTLTFQARAGEKGKLYGSITTADLAEALEDKLGQEFDRRRINTDPLRELGEHNVEIRLMVGVTASLKVIIESEDGEELEVPEELLAPIIEDEEEEAPVEELAFAEDESPLAEDFQPEPTVEEFASDTGEEGAFDTGEGE